MLRKFPKDFIHECNCSCSLDYLSNPFVYSASSRSISPSFCAVFTPRKEKVLMKENQNMQNKVTRDMLCYNKDSGLN